MRKNKFLTCLFIIILHTIPVRNLVLPLCAEDISNGASVSAQGEVELSAEQKIKKAKEYYLSGKQFIQQGNYSVADEEFKKAQQLLKGLSTALTQGPKQSPAVTPPNFKSLAVEAWETAKKGESEEAISHYLKAITLDPKNSDLHYNLAIEYLKTNQFMKASEALMQVIQMNPKDKDAYYNLGVLYESYFGDKKQAIAYYIQYIKLAGEEKDTGEVKTWIRQMDKEIRER